LFGDRKPPQVGSKRMRNFSDVQDDELKRLGNDSTSKAARAGNEPKKVSTA